MALEKKYYSGSQVFDIIRELPDKEFLFMLNTFAKERGADVVEVVRCKDCKWYDPASPCGTMMPVAYECKKQYRKFYLPEFYCGYAERRENG